MDPVKLIKQDHRTVKALFRRFAKTTRRPERQKIAEEIIEELSMHTAIEEQLIYPALRSRDPRIEGQVLQALEEHHAAKLTLAELDAMSADDERFAAKMHVVQVTVEKHMEEEELKLLPRLEKLLDADERTAMARAMAVMKQVAPNHPHPMASDTPPSSLVAAVIAKVNDAGKDLIRRFTNGEKAEGHRRVTRRTKATTAAVIAKRSRQTAAGSKRGVSAH